MEDVVMLDVNLFVCNDEERKRRSREKKPIIDTIDIYIGADATVHLLLQCPYCSLLSSHVVEEAIIVCYSPTSAGPPVDVHLPKIQRKRATSSTQLEFCFLPRKSVEKVKARTVLTRVKMHRISLHEELWHKRDVPAERESPNAISPHLHTSISCGGDFYVHCTLCAVLIFLNSSKEMFEIYRLSW